MTQRLGKRELNRVRRREAIINTATQSFLHRGYGETTMSGIADCLGGSKATLWSHFSSKEDLFAAVIDALVQGFSSDVDEVLTGQICTPETLRRACHRFLDCLLRPDSILLFRLVVSQGARFPEIRDLFYARGPAKIRVHFTEFLKTRFSNDQAKVLSNLIVATLNGYRVDILARPYNTPAEEHSEFINSFVKTIQWPPQHSNMPRSVEPRAHHSS